MTEACWTEVSSLSRTLAKMKLPVPVMARRAERNLGLRERRRRGVKDVNKANEKCEKG